MPKVVAPLRDLKIANAKPRDKDYSLFDGAGLFVLVKKNGKKSWRYKYTKPSGKAGLTVLGEYPDISLQDARKLRDDFQALLRDGVDPTQHGASREHSFEAVARQWHSAVRAKWSDSHAARVMTRLEQNVFPVIGPKEVESIKTKDLILLLLDIQKKSHEVASRCQQMITVIFRFAVQRAMIQYNPAQEITGCLIPPKQSHRPALPLERLPELIGRIDGYGGSNITRLALKLFLHTFVRSSELRFASWGEFDLDSGLWTIPAVREGVEGVKYSARGAKMQTPHLVPLSTQAVSILREIREISEGYKFVIAGARYESAMSENTVNKALRYLGYDTKTEVCGHGFRTMACSALNESGLFSRDAVERQMSHQERDNVRAAYIHKAEFILERRKMMQWWSDYLEAIQDKFIPPYEFRTGA